MNRILVAVSALTMFGCSDPPLLGSVSNGLTGEPIEGMRVVARASGSNTNLACQAGEAITGPDGTLTFKGLCSGVAYSIKDASGQMWFGKFTGVPADGAEDDLDIVAWRAPEGNGVYRLAGDEMHTLRRAADVGTEAVGKQQAMYPKTIPGRVTRISPGEHLVLTGTTVNSLTIAPLIESPVKEWWYLGVHFTSTTAFDSQDLQLDESQVVEKRVEDRVVRYVPAEALPEGRYALMADGDERMFLIDVGSAPATASKGG